MYSFDDNTVSISYKLKTGDKDAQYLSKRAFEDCREIKRVEKLSHKSLHQVIYFALTCEMQKIQAVSNKIKTIKGIDPIRSTKTIKGWKK
jgi:hypothetical protein